MNKLIHLALMATLCLLSQFTHAQSLPVSSSSDAITDISGSGFAGPFVGFKVGTNSSNGNGAAYDAWHTTIFPGLTAGYNFDLDGVVLGAEAFADFHNGSSTGKDAGIDAKFGMPFDQFMPYARLGVTARSPSSRAHWGLGVEYKFARHLSTALEWTSDADKKHGTRRTNDSVTIGLQYHFN
jgi:outer membrane immunogenic protein